MHEDIRTFTPTDPLEDKELQRQEIKDCMKKFKGKVKKIANGVTANPSYTTFRRLPKK